MALDFFSNQFDYLNDHLKLNDYKYSVNKENDIIILRAYEQENLEIELEQLSPGEQLILLLYIWEFTLTRFPFRHKFILLLDEPDAHLHPKLVHEFISILKKVCLSGAQVMMTTHNPSTVSFIPKKNLFVIREKKENGFKYTIENDDVPNIINELTDGLVVVSQPIKFVYVEGDGDRAYYERIKDLIAKSGRISFKSQIIFQTFNINNERGCNSIRTLISKFLEGQVINHMAIVDNDNNHVIDSTNNEATLREYYKAILHEPNNEKQQHKRILNIQRHSLENYILDPIYFYFYFKRLNPPNSDQTQLDECFDDIQSINQLDYTKHRKQIHDFLAKFAQKLWTFLTEYDWNVLAPRIFSNINENKDKDKDKILYKLVDIFYLLNFKEITPKNEKNEKNEDGSFNSIEFFYHRLNTDINKLAERYKNEIKSSKSSDVNVYDLDTNIISNIQFSIPKENLENLMKLKFDIDIDNEIRKFKQFLDHYKNFKILLNNILYPSNIDNKIFTNLVKCLHQKKIIVECNHKVNKNQLDQVYKSDGDKFKQSIENLINKRENYEKYQKDFDNIKLKLKLNGNTHEELVKELEEKKFIYKTDQVFYELDDTEFQKATKNHQDNLKISIENLITKSEKIRNNAEYKKKLELYDTIKNNLLNNKLVVERFNNCKNKNINQLNCELKKLTNDANYQNNININKSLNDFKVIKICIEFLDWEEYKGLIPIDHLFAKLKNKDLVDQNYEIKSTNVDSDVDENFKSLKESLKNLNSFKISNEDFQQFLNDCNYVKTQLKLNGNMFEEIVRELETENFILKKEDDFYKLNMIKMVNMDNMNKGDANKLISSIENLIKYSKNYDGYEEICNYVKIQLKLNGTTLEELLEELVKNKYIKKNTDQHYEADTAELAKFSKKEFNKFNEFVKILIKNSEKFDNYLELKKKLDQVLIDYMKEKLINEKVECNFADSDEECNIEYPMIFYRLRGHTYEYLLHEMFFPNTTYQQGSLSKQVFEHVINPLKSAHFVPLEMKKILQTIDDIPILKL